MITTVRYTTEDHVPLIVNDSVSLHAYPSGTHYDSQIKAWLEEGNVIAPYNEYYGWTLEQAIQIKSQESEEYAQALIDEAYANPTQGVVVVASIYKRRTESRRNDKADKQAADEPLTQEEKDESKTDQKLSEYETKCWDASDKVLNNIDKASTVDAIMAIDVATNTTWPEWIPPV